MPQVTPTLEGGGTACQEFPTRASPGLDYPQTTFQRTTFLRTTSMRYLPEGAVKRGGTLSWGGLVNCFLQSEHVLIFRSFFVASMCSGSCLCFCNASKLGRNKQWWHDRGTPSKHENKCVCKDTDITTHAMVRYGYKDACYGNMRI